MSEFDPRAIFNSLNAANVRYVAIGGIAMMANGLGRPTIDVDVAPDTGLDNSEALLIALRELGARFVAPGGKLLPVRHSAESLADTLERGYIVSLDTRSGPLDLLPRPEGVSGYEELASDALRVDLDGREVLVASLRALAKMKRAAGRPTDRSDLEKIEALIEAIAERGGR